MTWVSRRAGSHTMSQPHPPVSVRHPGAISEAAPAPHAGDAAGVLLSHGGRPQVGNARILLGFAVLLLLGAAALNVGIWSSARTRFENNGWARLEASADMRRDQIVYGLATFRREAMSLAEEPLVASVAPAFAAGRLTDLQRKALESEIVRAQSHFQFENVQLVAATGEVVYEVTPSRAAERRAVARLVTRTLQAGHETLGDPTGEELMLAAPLARVPGVVPVAFVVHTNGDHFFAPQLARWPGLGDASGAYLVRSDGDHARVLTDLASSSGLHAGQDVPLQTRTNLAVSMAATGIESRIEFAGPDGRPVWAVTRALPTVGWGLVSVADRADVLAGMRDTTRGLALLDIALLLGLFAIAVVWRRLHTHALTRQAMEITERHARRLQAVLDNAFDAIFTFDRAGRLRTVNHGAAQLFGRTPAELEGQPVSRFIQWGGQSSAALPAAGSVGVGEAVDRDGHKVPVEYSLGATGAGDELVHTAIVRDVSERAEAEKRIRAFAEGLEVTNHRLEEANAQLEEASRLKSEFLANTSHELRTPLNGMLGFLQLVLDGMCDSPEEEREFLQQALACSRHLLGLINDVLDIAKIESGKLALEVTALDVGHLFDEVHTLTHVQATQRGIQLSFAAELDDGVTARGDFGKVKQVLVNLVGNSLKFTPQGSINVRARSRVELGHVMFEIVDTGIGIPASRQEVIFEKFVQGDGSTTRRYGGTGLGLAISRSLVEMMGGIIGVESEGEGHGTRMYFSLPLWRESHRSSPMPVQSPATGPDGAPLVLVVEDDPVFRRFLTAVLHPRGYRTLEAANADEGWALLQKHTPACVVLDYALACDDGAQMRTGWDLAHRMTTQPATRHVPVVFVTGFDGELQAKLKGTTFARHPEHLLKPIDPGELVARIDALAQRPAGRPLRVLLADDDPGVTAYVARVLPRERFEVKIARNGEECLHALRTDAPPWDLLLLDLMMPEVSGYDVLREMTLSGLCPDLPVLVLTNFPEPRSDDERRLLERGLVVDVIAKSAVHAEPHLLPEILDHHLGRPLRPGAADPAAPDDLREAA
jgi:PAS domain S-box-containing protein